MYCSTVLTVLCCRRHAECSCDRRRERSRPGHQGHHRPEESDKSPSSGYSSQDSNTEEPPAQQGQQTAEKLLIDLSSPGGESKTTGWSDINIVDTDGDTEDKMRDLSFTDIALRKTSVPILSQLPQHALGSQLHIDSFVPSELTVESGKGECQQGLHKYSSDYPRAKSLT